MALIRSSRTSGDEVGEQDDRISNLPEDVIHYILSFLDTIDVVRASVVSRKWRCIWVSMPYLNLDNRSLDYVDSDDNDDVREQKNDEKFKDFVNWVLLSQDGSINIKRFRLCLCSLTDTDYQKIHRWISVLTTRRNIQEFELVSSQPHTTFKLPYCLVTCDSLLKLKLRFSFQFDCVTDLQLPTYTGFSRLISLTLGHLQLSDYILFRNFISSCPALENLDMKSCLFIDFKILDISSTSLKNLVIDNTEYGLSISEVKVACPNLVSFTFKAEYALAFSFEGLNSLQNVFIWLEEYGTDEECCDVMCKALEGIRNTKVLKLSTALSKLLCRTLNEPGSFPASFYNLKNLVLCVGSSKMQSIINLLEYTPNLEALTIFLEEWETTDHWKVTDKAISCLTYHLKVVELLDVNGNGVELELVRFLLSNGHVLQKMIIGWTWKISVDILQKRMIITDVMNFPRSSTNVALKLLEPTFWLDIYQYYYFYSF